MDNIIHADIHWGKRAVFNVLGGLNAKPEHWGHPDKKSEYYRESVARFQKAQEHAKRLLAVPTTIKPMHFAVLWRMNGLSSIQKVHGDGGPGNYHAVVPFTCDYEINVHPGTHLLHATYADAKKDKYYTTPTTMKTLHLQPGNMLLFHANIGHCGGRSSKVKNAAEKTFDEGKIDFDWVGGNNKMELTDLGMHYGIENCLFHKSIASDYLSGSIEQLRVGEITPFNWKGDRTVPNVNYKKKEIELKYNLQTAHETFLSYGDGKLVSEGNLIPEVFHMFNETTTEMKKYREHLAVKFGNEFRGDKNSMLKKRTSTRTRCEPERI
jgi:hypothetical protein